MVRFATVAAVLALMAAPLVAQESTEQLRKELESLRREVDGLKAGAQYSSQEIAGASKISTDGMAPDGDSPVMTLLKNTKLSGFVDAGYVVSFNGMNNSPGVNDSAAGGRVRLTDSLDNSFYLNAVQINIENLASKDRIVGYHLELAAGADPRAYEGNLVTIQEGWVQFWAPVGSGLDVRVGKMATLVGMEVLESINNNQYSRGAIFTNIQPFTQTGVRATYAVNEQFSGTLGFFNGINPVDTFADDDHGKAVEFQVAVKPSKDAYVNVTMVIGNDTANFSEDSGDLFYIFDIVAGYTIDKLVLGLNFTRASQQDTQATGLRGAATGLAAYIKYNMSDSFAPSFRAEYLSDTDGAVGLGNGGENGDGARLLTFTFTGEFRIAQLAIFRIELRHDNSNDHIFFRGGDGATVNPARGNTTLGFETILPF